MKKFIAAAIAAAIMSSSAAMVSAETFPHEFWALADWFTSAQDSGDTYGIIESAKAICDLLENTPKNSDTISVLGTRYQDIALAYEKLGDFASAAAYFEKYLPYGRELGWEDGVRIAEAKISYYEPVLDIYLETDSCPVYFGAKNEPASGVLYGEVAEQSREDESMRLIYVEFGSELGDWNENEIKKAAERGQAVEIALNFPNEGSTAAGVPYEGAYINTLMSKIGEYSGRIPIFIRIGAEMNVWDNACDPNTFITAYRTIADAAHSLAPGAALVWSVNHVAGWDTDTDAFYPGDEYVDWVGVSAYMLRYFQNQVVDNDDRIGEIMFHAGRAADPVYMLRSIVEKYGDRKPIMVAEGGASHYNYALGYDSTDWAVSHLRELYGCLPMVYPQIKLIAYFNNYVSPEANNYSLKDSAAMTAAYTDAVSSPVFIKKSASNRAGSYVKLDGRNVSGSINVASYAHFYEHDEVTVTYSIDGSPAATVSTAPYRATLSIPAGTHTVTAAAYAADGTKLGENSSSVTAEDKITVLYNGSELSGDVPATIIGGRTMVPLRLIFEAMGAEVLWDGDTRSISSTLGDKTVLMQVDNTSMTRSGETVTLDVPPAIVSGRTLVPVRAVAEAFGADVSWNGDTRTVVITY